MGEPGHTHTAAREKHGARSTEGALGERSAPEGVRE